MLIPTGTVHKATVAGATVKEVNCKHCSGRFFYVLRRLGGGRATAPLFVGMKQAGQQAVLEAQANLTQALEKDIDPVACLYCGRYQPEMVVFAKNRRFAFRWGCLGAFIAALLPVCFALAFLDQKAQETAGYVAYALGFGVLLAFGLLRRRYDPNRDAHTRIGTNAPGEPARFDTLENATAFMTTAQP